MVTLFWRTIPWLGAAAAGWVLLGALQSQLALQGQLGEAMTGVLRSMQESTQLTGETAARLEPLSATALSMGRMNAGLKVAGADLGEINGILGRVVTSQEQVLTGLEQLNKRTEGVVAALMLLDQENQEVLAANRALANRTENQAGSLEALSELTGEAAAYLERMNRRFSFLK